MCLVAFQKIFRKIFSGVWKRRRKTQIQKNTSHNPEKNHQRSRSTSRPRDLAFARSRSTLREIAPSITISIRRDLSFSRTRALSLSLSHFFWKSFEVKMEVVIDFRGQRPFFWVNGFQFPENRIFRTNQTTSFLEKHFRK